MSTSSSSSKSFSQVATNSSPESGTYTPLLTDIGYAGRQLEQIEAGKPYLVIHQQPKSSFRFRYESEMSGTHGCILGENSENKLKLYPTVELCNYHERAIISCRLVEYNKDAEHPHRLQLDTSLGNEVQLQVGPTEFTQAFADMAVIYTAKKSVPYVLFNRLQGRTQNQNEIDQLMSECHELAKQINLNKVRLKFTAHHCGTRELLCEPVYSNVIHNLKSAETNDLKICKMDLLSGSIHGSDEMILLTEKINKKNIEVHFVEENKQEEIVWRGSGRFMPANVHHQVAIVLWTPPYKDPTVTKNVNVYVQLYRPSDQKTSKGREYFYTYKADPRYAQNKKRKVSSMSSHSSLGSDGSTAMPTAVASLSDMLRNTSVGDAEMTMLLPQPIQDTKTSDYMKNLLPMPVGKADLKEALYLDHHKPEPTLAPPLEQASCNVASYNSNSVILSASNDILKLLRDDMNGSERASFEKISSETFQFLYDSVVQQPDDQDHNFFSDLKLQHWNPTQTDGAGKMSNKLKEEVSYPEAQMDSKVIDSLSEVKSAVDSRCRAQQNTSTYTAKYDTKDGSYVNRLINEFITIIKKEPDSTCRDQKIHEKLAQLMSIKLSNGDTFLHMITANKLIPVLVYLVQHIGRLGLCELLNQQNYRGETVLHVATKNMLDAHINLIVASGCDPMIEDTKGRTCLHYAVMFAKPSTLAALIASAKQKPNFTIDVADNERMTPLLMAVKDGLAEFVQLLIAAGASVLKTDSAGKCALHFAAIGDHFECLKLIVENMSEEMIDITDGNGNTALQFVCSGGLRTNTIRIAQLLCSHKANPLKSGGGNSCPIKLASKELKLLDVLRSFTGGVDVEIKSEPEDFTEESSSDEDDDEDEKSL